MEIKRTTIQRRLILDAVEELNTHPSAEQVYEHVTKQYPSISKTTVYRNLGQMSDAGELLNIGSFYGSAHYDHNCHTHYHFICEDCRRVFDIEAQLDEINNIITKMEGFEIKRHNLSFNGLCYDCNSTAMPNIKTLTV